jgi:hypothetical protein
MQAIRTACIELEIVIMGCKLAHLKMPGFNAPVSRGWLGNMEKINHSDRVLTV